MPARVANRRRQSIRDVFHSITQRAKEWPADALLIAGDLFDLERVTRDTTAFLVSEFSALGQTPVIITPGNHDPYVPSSPYVTEKWPDNVHIFSSPKWDFVSLLGNSLRVYGFAFDGYEISSNPFGSLEAPRDAVLNIAVAHGSERGHQPPDGKSYAPFDASSMDLPGLKYVALGHFHRATEIMGASHAKMWYSGMPEGQGFDQTGARHYLEVEVEDDKVRVQPVASSKVVFSSYELDCESLDNAQQVLDKIRAWALESPLPQVARIALTGMCRASISSELPGVYDAASGNFEHLFLLDQTVPAEDFEELARETSTLGAFITRMNVEIADAPDPRRRRVLERAREVGLAAHHDRKPAILGLDIGGETP
jgi:DNA repair exonuclease SbcCD nuclease subunit